MYAMNEAPRYQLSSQLRNLFTIILLYCQPSNPRELWDKFEELMCEDFLHELRKKTSNVIITDVIRAQALNDINNQLGRLGKTIVDYDLPNILHVLDDLHLMQDEMVLYEQSRSIDIYLMINSLNQCQQYAFNTIMNSYMRYKTDNIGKLFFIDGPGGTGKTFLYETIIHSIRRKNGILLAVASSGLASTLLPDGKTAHSTFKVPVSNLTEESICNISKQSLLADLIRKTEIIIWDEAPMNHKFVFEAVDKSLRDICNGEIDTSILPFEGKVVVFGRDFRQILPVVPKRSGADIIDATIKRSYIWRYVNVIHLKLNTRLQQCTDENNIAYAKYILEVGNGVLNDDDNMVMIPSYIPFVHDDIDQLISIIFGEISKIPTKEIHKYLTERIIICPKNKEVDMINYRVSQLITTTERIYYSTDTLTSENQSNLYTMEFINNFEMSGFPLHKLYLRIGIIVMVIRNISSKLHNGSRVIIKQLDNHVIVGEIVGGKDEGLEVFIPRIPILSTHLPCEFIRRHFPVKPAFAITINKCQGQTLSTVGIYLNDPVFPHEQLYVALSRVRDIKKVVLCVSNKNNSRNIKKIKNVVFKEIFE